MIVGIVLFMFNTAEVVVPNVKLHHVQIYLRFPLDLMILNLYLLTEYVYIGIPLETSVIRSDTLWPPLR